MMKSSRLRVSLVIPAYNEESHLGACLEAACAQAVPFDEIIVVDNNSTDRTAAIAGRFSQVTVISETHQGKVYARSAGFDTATGDVIARIDADTLVPAEWNARLHRIFATTKTDAVSGRPRYYDVALPRFCTAVENTVRKLLAYELRDMLFLQGANMAIRRTAWHATKQYLCDRRDIHEDYDIAIHMQEHGYRVIYDEQLVAGLSGRAVDVSLPFFVSYVRMNTRTYATHQAPHYRRMYPAIALVFLLFFPMRTLFRGRRPDTGKFSVAQLFAPRALNPRVADADGSYLS